MKAFQFAAGMEVVSALCCRGSCRLSDYTGQLGSFNTMRLNSPLIAALVPARYTYHCH